MASERCACPCHRYGEGCDCCQPIPAPSSGAILTREAIEALIDRDGSCEPWEYRILAYDAALRDEVERLTRERDEVQERLDAAEGEGDTLEADNVLYQKQCVAWKARADAAEAERNRLRRVIEEAPHDSRPGGTCNSLLNYPGSCDCWKAAALKREERKS